jgi:aarF domain-containing kinase
VTEVAVKVQHPGVHRALADDLTLVRFWSTLLGSVPGLSFFRAPVPLDEFSLVVQRQADFFAEAAHLRRFSANFRDSPVRVVFPTPHSSLVASSWLVETWEEGTDIQEYIDRRDPLNVELGDLGYQVFMTMMLVHNFMHAVRTRARAARTCRMCGAQDCHAGNVHVRLAAARGAPPTLVVLDAGLVTEMTLPGRKHLRQLLLDVFMADGTRAADMYLSLSSAPCADPDGFRRDMKELFDARCHTNVNVGQLIVGTMSLVRRHRLVLASEFASVIISMGLLEGMARALDPKIDPVRKLRPFLLKEAVSVAKVLIADQAKMIM